MSDPRQRFREAFRTATRSDLRPDGVEPFPWQERLALARQLPRIVDAPTGTGKTEAVVMAWLWRRRLAADRDAALATPRRLVFVLPMRVLVEQTQDRVRGLVDALAADGRLDADVVHVHALLGGAAPADWTLRRAPSRSWSRPWASSCRRP